MKRIGYSMLLAIVLILSTSTAVFAKGEIIKIYLDGERLNVSTDPIIESGTTLVPMRSIFEGLGMDVTWDGLTRTITGVGNNVTIKLTVGENKAKVNGKEVVLAVPAKIINGTTLVPIRFVSESVGSDVKWDGNARTIKITSTNYREITDFSNNLYVENGVGKYSGYMKLLGFPDEDKYQIYFNGDQNSFTTTIEDLRGIDLNESIIWKYNGKSLKNSRKELYGFFSDTSWFRNNLGIYDYTLTQEWFEDTFGNVFWDWAEGIGFSHDAARWVEKYFYQEAPTQNRYELIDFEFEYVETPEI